MEEMGWGGKCKCNWGGGRWEVGNGKWEMGGGKWEVGGGEVGAAYMVCGIGLAAGSDVPAMLLLLLLLLCIVLLWDIT